MKTSCLITLAVLLTPLWAQTQSAAPRKAVGPPRDTVVFRTEMGKWWQRSDVVKKLQLTDSQVAQLEQTFYDHRLKLIDYTADMEKQDLKLQNLLDADVPDEGQVDSQVDQVLAARGKLEREFTMMNLDLRKVLTLDQWRQLKSMRGAVGPQIFFKKVLPGGGGWVGQGPQTEPLSPDALPLSPPGLPPDEMF